MTFKIGSGLEVWLKEGFGFAQGEQRHTSDVWKPAARLPQETQSFTFCVETDYLHENGTLYHDTNLEPIVWSRFRAAAAALGRFDVSGCEDVADLCLLPSARLLRMICGDTCGCTDPLSSGWHLAEGLTRSSPALFGLLATHLD